MLHSSGFWNLSYALTENIDEANAKRFLTPIDPQIIGRWRRKNFKGRWQISLFHRNDIETRMAPVSAHKCPAVNEGARNDLCRLPKNGVFNFANQAQRWVEQKGVDRHGIRDGHAMIEAHIPVTYYGIMEDKIALKVLDGPL